MKQILTDVKKCYLYPESRRIQMRISADNPHPVTPLLVSLNASKSRPSISVARGLVHLVCDAVGSMAEFVALVAEPGWP